MSEHRKCRKFTAKQKLEIVLASLRGDRSVGEICREHGSRSASAPPLIPLTRNHRTPGSCTTGGEGA